MKAIDRILAPTDLTEVGRVGVDYALDLACAVHAEVIIYHVAPFEEGLPDPLGVGEISSAYMPTPELDEVIEAHRAMLERFVHNHFPPARLEGLKLSLDVDVGEPEDDILEKARAAEVDLIVMATHGRTGLEHVLLGSVTEHIVRKAECPVLSIRYPIPSGTP